MFNNLILVTVTKFSGTTTTDKNGEESVMLQLLAGKMPNRQVIAGTVARRNGFEIGRTYLAQVIEVGIDEDFGRDFTFRAVKEITNPLDIIDACDKLGEPEVIFIPRPENWEEIYLRKSDAVEGIRAKRIHEGKYRKLSGSPDLDHSNAKAITEGTSMYTSGKKGTDDPAEERKNLEDYDKGKGREEGRS